MESDVPANEELSPSRADDLLQPPHEQSESAENDGDEEPDEAEETEVTSGGLEISSLRQALHYAQQLKFYSLEADMGELHSHKASSCTVIEKAIVKIQSTLKQSTIDGYFLEMSLPSSHLCAA